jgi:hypothetical protein
MSKFLDHTFSELTQAFCKHHQKTQNDEQIYMELKNMKQEETKRVKVYYKRIQKMAHDLQVPTTYNFLTTMFKVGLQSYFKIVIARMNSQHYNKVRRRQCWLKKACLLQKQGVHF